MLARQNAAPTTSAAPAVSPTARSRASWNSVAVEAANLAGVRECEAPPASEVSGALTRYGMALEIMAAKGFAPAADSADPMGDFYQNADWLKLFTAGATRLGEPVTRKEAALFIVRAWEIEELPRAKIVQVFSDLPSTHWAAPEIYAGVKLGVFKGADRAFRPDDGVTTKEAAFFVAQAGAPATPSFDPTKAPTGFEWLQAETAGQVKGKGTPAPPGYDTEQRKAGATTIVNELDVKNPDQGYRAIDDESKNVVSEEDILNEDRYKRGAAHLTTYCNIYAEHYCALMGAFLPLRWTSDITTTPPTEKDGPLPEGVTIQYLNANKLCEWLAVWGPTFGWAKVGDTGPAGYTAGQEAANGGGVVVIGGQRTNTSGHMSLIVQEVKGEAEATRDETGLVTEPVISEAGTFNSKRTTRAWGTYDPANGEIWVHQ